MTETELAWSAGFFDGEGCILANRSGASFSLRAKVSQVVPEPLEQLRRWFGGNIWYEKAYGRSVWTVSGYKARLFLRAILPYLVVKRDRATLALSVTPRELHAIPNRISA